MLKLVNYILIFLTVLSYISPFVTPHSAWPIAFVSVFFPWYLLFNLLFVIYWGYKKNKFLLWSAITLIIGYQHIIGFINYSKPIDCNEKTLKVMSYNLAGLSQLDSKNKTVEMSALSNFILSQNCDVLCFQEFIIGETAVKQLATKLKLDNYTYRNFIKEKAVIIFSKFPMTNNNQIYFDPPGNGFIFSDINFNGRKARIFCGHLHSSTVSTNANRLANIAEDGKLDRDMAVLEMKGMLGKFRNTSKIRATEAENIAFELNRSPYPNIVCCDMNETPQSYAYHLITNDLVDGFKKVGSGIGTTYNGVIPALRIDFVFASPKFTFCNYQISNVSFSDHFPVIATVQFP